MVSHQKRQAVAVRRQVFVYLQNLRTNDVFFVSHTGTKDTKKVFAIFNFFVNFVALCEKNIGHQGKCAGTMLP
jgi:hypothetical protein